MSSRKNLAIAILFGIAFAVVEAAVVTYIRHIIDFSTTINNLQYKTIINLGVIAFVSTKTPILGKITNVETIREFATIIMLLCVGFLGGSTIRKRLLAFIIAFSVWDLFYYVFLICFTGWPKSLFDIDVYFLIPVVWIGPVITPVIISLILLFTGSYLYLKKPGV